MSPPAFALIKPSPVLFALYQEKVDSMTFWIRHNSLRMSLPFLICSKIKLFSSLVCQIPNSQQPTYTSYAYMQPSLCSVSYRSACIRHFTCLLIYPKLPGCSCVPVRSFLSSPDGIISVILSHYRSSDANGYIANPAASSLDQCPYPLFPALWQLCLAQWRQRNTRDHTQKAVSLGVGGGTSPRRAGEDGGEVLLVMREVAVQEIELGL